uniref:Uncharacterized protein n=1 Tax=Glossina brevipalpis TaxID=37001 RepID=A0A1A9WRF4_9MUSC
MANKANKYSSIVIPDECIVEEVKNGRLKLGPIGPNEMLEVLDSILNQEKLLIPFFLITSESGLLTLEILTVLCDSISYRRGFYLYLIKTSLVDFVWISVRFLIDVQTHNDNQNSIYKILKRGLDSTLFGSNFPRL